MNHGKLIMKNLVLIFSIGTFAIFATISAQVAHAQNSISATLPTNSTLDQIKRTGPGCGGALCAGKDPTLMSCLTSVHFLPYKKAEYYQGQLVGYFSSVYSNTCNTNWDQAELTPDAVSQGWRVSTQIETTDSNGQYETARYPVFQEDPTFQGPIPVHLFSYGGETGWPTVSDMVDGTRQTHSTFYLYDKNGNVLMKDDFDLSVDREGKVPCNIGY